MGNREETKIPLPGDFAGPPQNSVRVDEPLRSKEERPLMTPLSVEEKIDVNSVSSGLEMKVGDKNKGEKEELFQLPTKEEEQEQYLKGLKAARIEREEAAFIMDAVIFEGLYTEKVNVCNRVDVVLGTRDYRDLQRTAKYIDNAEVVLPMHVNDLIARYNLAASLRQYGDKTFVFPKMVEADSVEAISIAFQTRLDFVYALPEVVVSHLIQRLHEFDYKIGAVFAKGAPEDF